MTAPEAAATFTKQGSVGLITLNRPAALNAVNAALSTAVGEALQELDRDPGITVGVITGAGRAFCAGADLKALGAGLDISAPGHPDWGFAGLVGHAVQKPLIAAVNGFALGGGTEIVLACDLAVLSEDAALGLPEVKRGLFAGAAGLLRLPRQFPAKLAMEHALTGRPIDPTTAVRHGLVNSVVPAADVLPTALALAEEIAANAPLAIRASKELVRAATGTGTDWDRELHQRQDEQMARVLASADAKEGAAAFAEKRRPVWTGA